MDEQFVPGGEQFRVGASTTTTTTTTTTTCTQSEGVARGGNMGNNGRVGNRDQGTLTGLDTETLPPIKAGVRGADPQVVGLTILCHPDPGRIGEQAHLQPLAQGQSVTLSRRSPDFRQPGAPKPRPLGDPYVSRKTLELAWSGDVLQIGGDVARQGLVVDGQAATVPFELSETRLEQGVVLELAGRVALLLHFLGMPRQPGPLYGLVGHSEAIARVRQQVGRVAGTDVPVLLRGESGTGKELAARAIHDRGARRGGPFVSVNMAAIPAQTAASGLFGHVKGAFTGAATATSGFFGQAEGGTLFLDEIGDTPTEIQALLLRALESGEVQPVGAETVRHADVRLVAATEIDLEKAASEGRFRSAFLHRLAGFELDLPPLRERRDDVARLLVHFLGEELQALGQRHKLAAPTDRTSPPLLDPGLLSRLARFPWPGNVRQLRNVVRHLVIGSQDSQSLVLDETVERILAEEELAGGAGEVRSASRRRSPRRRASARVVSDISDAKLVEALRECGFRPGPAAERLGIGRTTIYKLIDQCAAIRKASDIPDAEILESWSEHDGDAAAVAGDLEVSLRALKLRLKKLDLS